MNHEKWSLGQASRPDNPSDLLPSSFLIGVFFECSKDELCYKNIVGIIGLLLGFA